MLCFTSNLNQKVYAAANNVACVYTPEEALAISIAVKNIDAINCVAVSDVDSLPLQLNASSTYPNGTVVYITQNDVHVMAVNGCWVTLDGEPVVTPTTLQQVWGWGSGLVQLGYCAFCELLPTTLPSTTSIKNWSVLSAGSGGVLGIDRDSTLWAWGFNDCGQLGDNTGIDRSSPVSVVGGFTDWCQVSAGGTKHSVGIRKDGSMWTWGAGGFGRLGDGTTTTKSSPIRVIGDINDWCQVSAGDEHSLAIRTNGTLWAWGQNGCGRLGDGTVNDRSSPVSVLGGFTDWCQASAGGQHSLGLRSNGTLWAWGYGAYGRLGDGSNTNNKLSPVSVVGGFTDWCQASAGTYHSLAIRTNGTLWAWGRNHFGQLGDNTIFANKSSPVSVIGGFTDWCQVSAGFGHSTGLRTDGTLWAWGSNNFLVLGQCGTSRCSPISIGTGGGWTSVSSPKYFGVGLRYWT
jgi:alpha-tubulin suppressor-like RCC1 family protein